MVLYDFTHGHYYTGEVWLLKVGRVITKGAPKEVMTCPLLISDVYDVDIKAYQTADCLVFL